MSLGLVASCSSSTTNEGTGGAPAGGSSGAGTGGTSGAGGSGAGTSGGTSGTGSSGGATGGSGGSGGSAASDAGLACPTNLPGPPMVAAEGNAFCIDKTEVTNEQYGKFLAEGADAGAPLGLNACLSFTDRVPGGDPSCPALGTDAKYPVRCIDWCSAYAYCKWAGKRLCGNVGGLTSSVSNVEAGGTNEWFTACAGVQGQDTYPYGTNYDKENCAVNTNSSSPKQVGSMSACESFTSKALDLSGNVAEWEDSCDNEAAEGANCLVRGGSYLKDSADVKCGAYVPLQRGTRALDVGFRCCWEP